MLLFEYCISLPFVMGKQGLVNINFLCSKLWLAVISVDDYPFLAFSELTFTLRTEDTEIGVLWLQCAAWLRRTNLEVVTKSFSHQAKAPGSFGAMFRMEMCYYSYFHLVVWTFPRSLGVIFVLLQQMSSQWGLFHFKDWCLMKLQPPTFLLLA